MYPKIVLIGQVNAGKSSLFNKLIDVPKALVSKIPGTTRDRNYAECEWRGKKFILIDTAGVEGKIDQLKANELLKKAIDKQSQIALQEANLILFLIDIRRGLNQIDVQTAQVLKKTAKPVILVLNKADGPKWLNEENNPEYWRLGLGEPILISAVTGMGTGDLLDLIIKKLSSTIKKPQPTKTERPTKVAIIGRPNVGKSSLMNAILGEERVVVSPIPHTTREPQDSLFYFNQQPFLLIDTAGIRKKSKIKLEIEKVGVLKSLSTIRRAEVVILTFDITERIGHQDKALFDFALENNKGIVLVINKIDLIKNFSEKFEKFIEYYQWNLPGAKWAPIIFVSAIRGQNIKEILNIVNQVKENRLRKIASADLDTFLRNIVQKKKFKDTFWLKATFSQISVAPPSFLLKISPLATKRKLLHQAQLDIIEKELRRQWLFDGTPIKINVGIIK